MSFTKVSIEALKATVSFALSSSEDSKREVEDEWDGMRAADECAGGGSGGS